MTGSKIVNLCFHGIGTPGRVVEPGERGYWIDPELYYETLDEIVDRPDVRLSFDDGNMSDVEIGLDALLSRGLKATFFVLAGRLDEEGSLGREHLRLLRRSGMGIGSHGLVHVPWRGLSDEDVYRELVVARDEISDASGSPVRQAALPLGRYDRRVLGHLRGYGYTKVFSSDRIPATDSAWLQPRYSLRDGDTIQKVREQMLAPPTLLRSVRVKTVGLGKRLR